MKKNIFSSIPQHRFTLLSALVFFFTFQYSFFATAQTTDLRPMQVNIFKNGTYFIAKEGKVTGSVAKFPIPPNPLQSTYWIFTTKENKISRIDIFTDTVKVLRKPTSIYDFALANKGKQASVVYTFGQGNAVRTAEGTIKEFALGNMLKLENSSGLITLVNTQNILEFSLKEKENEKLKVDSTMRISKVIFKSAVTDEPVLLSYMSTGIQWLPSYNIRITDGEKLMLEMKALVENYSEGISDADVSLTVGKPQMLYGSAVDAIANDFFTGGDNSYTSYQYNPYAQQFSYSATAPFGSAMYDNSVVSEEKSNDISGYNGTYQWTTDGEKTNDLYVYKLGRVSLPKNTKSSFSIFSSSLPYEDLYEVNIYDYVNFYSSQYIPDKDDDKFFDVYHSLRITNTTNFPFTTAPVFVQDEKLNPLAQDQIKYTPKGGKVKIQLSKAVDVQVKGTEQEISRSETLKKFKNASYRKVTIKGTIHVENLQDKSIKLNVTKNINGLITDASDDGVITKPGKYAGLNPNTTTEWNINLSGNEKKDITYTYEVWIYAAGN